MVLSDDQLKQILLDQKIAPQTLLDELLALSKQSGISLYDTLIERDVITDEKLGLITANFLGFPFVTLAKTTIPEEVFTLLPEKVARKQKVLTFERSKDGIKLAMANPNNTTILKTLSRKTGEKIISYFATEKDIENTLRIYKKDLQKLFDNLLSEAPTNQTTPSFDDTPIAKIVDLLIESAYEDKTSDVHIEPEEKNSLIRFRIDGILHDVVKFPKNLHDRIITRIKVLSRLRTDEHLSAQDGKMQLQLEAENLDIRISILPVVDGEKAVLRLLSTKSRKYSLIDLGISDKDLKNVTSAFNKSYGMILSTGPTGSGKTTSIYSILKILNTREKNITTIEDPVEYRMKGVNQIQVNPKTNLTFASGLRSVLRQDPNIVFVGEIRDSETAGIAVNAALTGHLVLSTLHTNDAATALPRLIDMGIEPFLVASTVNVIIAQRLVRKNCDMCKVKYSVKKSELLKDIPKEIIEKRLSTSEDIEVYKGEGCKICHGTGYGGRVGIFEVLLISKDIKKLIAEKSDSDVIVSHAIENGMTTMLDDGLEKVKKGSTTIEEVLRVTKVEIL
ncbi:MAG: hypothetical protein A3F31_05410 [Candidatus Levybacteria bacterium RIFCSPHIGHO2_12_FULL_38_12]|nr:MAG: hypothetical protein A2770_02470 [Candidatus Levybacteria bacterium RIFCSPHIGHO2_01_FULL_38_12]OGH22456.1 MAG: hypothetical protein A3F31_05410 [Candidatus Levybacteria bacterium RIFCSPHIGHO2_12_FULL_38_12]OGH44365.1 MAG: hypothetical protein A3J14_02175 [Candidatus Levybacteria bacterium RIFCSPLOWO2_02_FULL_37_18]OGH51310.1 MAG: hypothetical protein A3G13_03350 [Candidatus Levybacteria bacterium RIFCSPLOWO2_12_FULL_37_7]